MRPVTKWIGQLAEAVSHLLRWVLGLGLAILLATVLIQVAGRFVFSSTPPWAEALSGLLLTWISFLGAALAIRSDENLNIALLPGALPDVARNLLIAVVAAATGVFAWILVSAGTDQVELTASSRILGLNIASAWLYLCAPVSGALMLIFLVEQALKAAVDLRDGTNE